MRGARGLVAILAIALVGSSLGSASAPARSRGRFERRASDVAPGITYTRIVDERGPNRLFLLTIDPSTAATIEVALSQRRLAGVAPTSAIARRRGALAAVNGDFFLPNGQLIHPLVEALALRQSGFQRGQSFTFSSDERAAIGVPHLAIEATEGDGAAPRAVSAWNLRRPRNGEIVGYTAAGEGVAEPPAGACSARLLASGDPGWSPGNDGFQRTYDVDRSRCGDRVGPKGGVVLSARRHTKQGDAIAAMVPGERVRLAWSLGPPRVVEAVGGAPLLVAGGQNVAPTHCWSAEFCRRHPRTGIGITQDGRILLLVVDGRAPGYSVGMTPRQLARAFLRLGAVSAMNLDGGGSSTMVVDGRIVNRPSDGRERPVASVLLVSKEAAAGGTPDPLPALPLTPGLPRVRVPRVLEDAASTGGLLDAAGLGALGSDGRALERAITRLLPNLNV